MKIFVNIDVSCGWFDVDLQDTWGVNPWPYILVLVGSSRAVALQNQWIIFIFHLYKATVPKKWANMENINLTWRSIVNVRMYLATLLIWHNIHLNSYIKGLMSNSSFDFKIKRSFRICLHLIDLYGQHGYDALNGLCIFIAITREVIKPTNQSESIGHKSQLTWKVQDAWWRIERTADIIVRIIWDYQSSRISMDYRKQMELFNNCLNYEHYQSLLY